MEKPQFELQKIIGITVTRQQVMVDGFRYEKCHFVNCEMQYFGGPAQLSECELSPDTTWKFGGTAGFVISVLTGIGFRLEFGQEGNRLESIPTPGPNIQ